MGICVHRKQNHHLSYCCTYAQFVFCNKSPISVSPCLCCLHNSVHASLQKALGEHRRVLENQDAKVQPLNLLPAVNGLEQAGYGVRYYTVSEPTCCRKFFCHMSRNIWVGVYVLFGESFFTIVKYRYFGFAHVTHYCGANYCY